MRSFKTLQSAASATVLVLATSVAAKAQYTVYSTGFDGTDTVNNTQVTAVYPSPPAANTDPLAGFNGWASNDQAVGTGSSTQQVGDSNFVGPYGAGFTGQAAGLGGFYRSTAPTTANPDVIPSTAAPGGTSSLFHSISLPSAFPSVTFSTNFYIAKNSTSFPSRDSFAFTLGSATSNLISVNFTPTLNTNTVTGTNPTSSDDISFTLGGNQLATGTGSNGAATTVGSRGNGVFLAAQYTLTVMITNPSSANPTATATFTGSNSLSFSVSLNGPVTASSITQISELWTVADQTLNTAGNGYQNAGDNQLLFDNVAVTIPEPSTYAMMTLGLLGLVGLMRVRRQRA